MYICERIHIAKLGMHIYKMNSLYQTFTVCYASLSSLTGSVCAYWGEIVQSGREDQTAKRTNSGLTAPTATVFLAVWPVVSRHPCCFKKCNCIYTTRARLGQGIAEVANFSLGYMFDCYVVYMGHGMKHGRLFFYAMQTVWLHWVMFLHSCTIWYTRIIAFSAFWVCSTMVPFRHH